ncbi:DUF2269 family protein [Chachezhania sediminis]|uniref:DUF2269 family protein n=1 Tax=Chachezhania sediminis TaxID=2599291 RepID=UPI00131ACB52|nr:DUF2269 family protein [Chachezhania sediminis]
MVFDVVLFLNVVCASVIIGTGSTILVIIFLAHRTADPVLVAHAAASAVQAAVALVVPAAFLQFLTGMALTLQAGQGQFGTWMVAAMLLNALVGAVCLVNVVLQVWMRNVAALARDTGGGLPRIYRRAYRIWVVFGVPGLGGAVAILGILATGIAL